MANPPGIGPASTLSQFSIPVLSDLPGVGQNLWDQVFIGVNRGITVPSTSAYLASPEHQALALEQYRVNASGPYSAGAAYLSFEKLPQHLFNTLSNRTKSLLVTFPEDWPNIEYVPVGFGNPSFNPNISGSFPTLGGFGAILLTPLSRGNVTLRSASISDPPEINLNWLTDPADLETLIAAVKRAREALNSDAIANITVGPELSPGATVATDEQIGEFVRSTAQTIWHACCTARMGKRKGDKGAVVDSKGRVLGVKGLRVVDNSIAPFAVPGHSQASVYMLAEKIVADILGER